MTTRFESKIFGNLETTMLVACKSLDQAEFYARRLGMTETADALRLHAEDVRKMGVGLYERDTWDMYVAEDDEEAERCPRRF